MDKADVFIQWKGTKVCLDFRCVCGVSGHLDDEFTYYLHCRACGRFYKMPETLALEEIEKPEVDAGIVGKPEVPVREEWEDWD